jgi:hypothetical protein
MADDGPRRALDAGARVSRKLLRRRMVPAAHAWQAGPHLLVLAADSADADTLRRLRARLLAVDADSLMPAVKRA